MIEIFSQSSNLQPCGKVDDETMLVMNIVNREWSDGVIFCRGPSSELGGIFLDEGRTQSVVGSPVDCSNENSAAAEQWGAGVPDLTTLCIGLRKEEINLFFPQGSNWPSGTCWFQDAESNKVQSLCKGPMYQSQVEFTITSVVSWDLTSVEGVSGGLTMNYTDFTGDARNVVAIPPAFKGAKGPNFFCHELFISKAPGAGFPTVLADKHRYGECYCPSYDPGLESCNSDACFTGCPSSLADNPCGQHRCRQWYAKSYLTDESYCGWLFSNHAQTYCWAMDESKLINVGSCWVILYLFGLDATWFTLWTKEWRCLDDSCGYGGIGQPNQEPYVLSDPNVGGRANVYSCGQQKDQKAIHGVWWEYGVGCIDKEAGYMPTNPIVPRRGGQIHISFENLPWLHVEEAE
eukprot:Skav205321  [mRNA]  locus=scaffold3444:292965:297795:- [translate_table: standard]